MFLQVLLILLSLSYIFSNSDNQDYLYDISMFSSKLPSYLPNIEYLGQGYNIFFGNPHSTTGLDPGFKNQLVIEYQYEHNNKDSLSGDMRWIIPKGVKFSSYQSCSTSYSSNEISTIGQYSQSIQAGVHVGGSFPVASFSASADYKQVEKTLSQNNSMFVESHAKCVLFDIGLYLNKNTQNLKFKDEFIRKLKNLAKKNSKYDFIDFFQEYGTHLTTQVKLGSKFGFRFQLSKDSKEQIQSKGVSVGVAASYYCASASFSTTIEQQSSNSFRNSLQNWEQFSFGAPPDPNNDVAKWASQAITNSLPVEMNLIPYQDIIDFITTQNLGDEQLTNTEKNILKQGLQDNLLEYCKYLQLQKIITSCIIENTNTNIISFENRVVYIQNVRSGRSIKFFTDGNISVATENFYDGSNDFQFELISKGDNKYLIKNLTKQQCLSIQYERLAFENCQYYSRMIFTLEFQYALQGITLVNICTEYKSKTEQNLYLSARQQSENSLIMIHTQPDKYRIALIS